MFTQAVTFSGLAAIVSGHILISNPAPYGASSLDLLPLKMDGSDFPCKQREGVYNLDGASNVYPQGSTQQLSFTGTTVYGGGSCQISITQDLQPNADSVWKVIKSIEGGCPARNVTGNLEGDLMDPTPDTYDFTIPADLPAGDYSLAWTWFNKIGNREMYMNCAPLTVTGTEGDVALFESLPDMFVANVNVGGSSCSTTEGTDIVFPQPGDDISRENVATDAFAAPVGACPTGASEMPPVGQDPVMPPMPTETPSILPAPVDTPIVAPPPVVSSPAASATSGMATPVLSTSATLATPTAGPVEGVPADALTGPCCTEGLWNCIDGSSFQRCASGVWSIAQPVSEGTTCEKGQSMEFHMLPVAPRPAFMQRRRRSVL
ncbi:Chitin-binding, domain 3 [Paramyrothecium foliicola]|nr:Chitin-binding, domain 3 [Paramyrothecium foliicola]